MNLGTLFLQALSTGIISEDELIWVALHQQQFSRCEAATALRLGRLLDSGKISVGCRL